MALGLVIIGIVLIVAAIRDTQTNLYTLLEGDFTGQGNFFYWVVAIVIVGAIGNFKPIRPISNSFLALIIVVFILKNGGFFSNLQSAIQGTTTVSTTGSSSTTNTVSA